MPPAHRREAGKWPDFMTTAAAKDMLHRYEERYGKLAFGVLTLLIVWHGMVRPTLDSNTQTAKYNAETTNNLARVAESFERQKLAEAR